MFERPPGTLEICKICSWQDCHGGLLNPTKATGPNHVSLLRAQENYKLYGAKELRLKRSARNPGPDDRRDPCWRAIDLSWDRFDPDARPASREQLYYWRKNYWLRNDPNE